MQENVLYTSLKPRWKQTARWLALIGGVINPIAFVLAYMVAGTLRPGYSPIHQAISDLGVGPNGWLLDTIAVLYGLLLIAFAGGFSLSMRQVLTVGWRWFGTAFLVLAGLRSSQRASSPTHPRRSVSIRWRPSLVSSA